MCETEGGCQKTVFRYNNSEKIETLLECVPKHAWMPLDNPIPCRASSLVLNNRHKLACCQEKNFCNGALDIRLDLLLQDDSSRSNPEWLLIVVATWVSLVILCGSGWLVYYCFPHSKGNRTIRAEEEEEEEGTTATLISITRLPKHERDSNA